MSHSPRRIPLKIGLLPLADATPLIVAEKLGLFARAGLDVTLTPEASWSAIRDKLASGLMDAAQMLATMPLTANLGIDGMRVPMSTALVLSRNGSSITVSNDLYAAMGAPSPDPLPAGAALRRVLDEDRAAGRPRRVFAHVFPYSPHEYLLRDWLAAADIDPDRDVSLIVVPPPLMVRGLGEGRLDGYCVAAPWGMAAESAGIGQRLLPTRSMRSGYAEKVLGVSRAWAASNPETHVSMVAALIAAGHWLAQAANRVEAAQMLIDTAWIHAPAETLRAALVDDASDPCGPRIVFGDATAGAPLHEDAHWFLSQMQRWGEAAADVDRAAFAASSFDVAANAQAAAVAASLQHGIER